MRISTSAAFGMPAMTPATGVVSARASRQRAAGCAIAVHDAKRAGLTVDVPGAPAWSPPV